MPTLRPILRPILSPLTRAIGAAGGVAGFSPLSLFASGEQGAWYDPSDLTTMFQDSAGTTAAAIGQPVGLVLDKRKGLVKGSERWANPTLGATWTNNGDGSFTTNNPSGTFDTLSVSIPEGGKSYWVTFNYVTTGNGIDFRVDGVTSLFVLANTSGVFSGIVFADPTSPTEVLFVRRSPGVAGTATISTISVRELPGNHATQATTALKPILRQSGSLYYLEFDGVDDGMVTASIDFTATDKMTVFAGVRQNMAQTGAVVELGASGGGASGGFGFLYGGSGTNHTHGTHGGTAAVSRNYAIANATSYVVSVAYDHAQSGVVNELKPRLNGSVPTTTDSGADAGGGNFANAILYYGRRGGASLAYAGNLYSLIIRGALTDAAGITNGETFTATKTGVVL